MLWFLFDRSASIESGLALDLIPLQHFLKAQAFQIGLHFTMFSDNLDLKALSHKYHYYFTSS